MLTDCRLAVMDVLSRVSVLMGPPGPIDSRHIDARKQDTRRDLDIAGPTMFAASVLTIAQFLRGFCGALSERIASHARPQKPVTRGLSTVERLAVSIISKKEKCLDDNDLRLLDEVLHNIEWGRFYAPTDYDMDAACEAGEKCVSLFLGKRGLSKDTRERVGRDVALTVYLDIAPAHVLKGVDHSRACALDFLFVAALEEEVDALAKQAPGLQRTVPTSGDIHSYLIGSIPVVFPNGVKSSYRIGLMQLLGMGRVEAAVATTTAIATWSPRYVTSIGIAGGVAERNVNLGDVLVSDQVVDYELQKLTAAGPEMRWEVYRSDPRILSVARQPLIEDWQNAVERPQPGRPKRHIGTIASGDKVFAAVNALKIYRDKWPTIIGLEMEAAGIARSAFQSAPQPGFFMVRGVSDLADEAKDSITVRQWRSYACTIAAAYALALLRQGPIAPSLTVLTRPQTGTAVKSI